MIESISSIEDPSIRYKIMVGVLQRDPDSKEIKELQSKIRKSPRVQSLLINRDENGYIRPVNQPYKKWFGAHWVFARLADIGYPPGDADLIPIRDQVFNYWLHPRFFKEYICNEAPQDKEKGVPIIQGRARRCASQQGNALFSAVALGLIDDRCQQLADLLIHWQWPDGGWNCDRRSEACHSSFWESLIPLRGLAWYAKASGDARVKKAAKQAAEIFLERRLYRRIRDGQIMNKHFIQLHYPCYWKYDILFALKVLAEAGFIGDHRCDEALDLLQSKRLANGGWPAEKRFYKNSKANTTGSDLVSWGVVSKKISNEWITADALYVLRSAGRISKEELDQPTI